MLDDMVKDRSLETRLLDEMSEPNDRDAPNDSHRRVMGTLAVAAVGYFSVSGGPIGSEGIFAAGGPRVGLLALSIFPFLWCIPTALMTAELSTAFPENGGFTVWVYHAFGPFWAFQEGFWAWLSAAIDNAIYPSFTVRCLCSLVPSFATWGPLPTWLLKCAIAVVFALPNMLGVQLVGRGAILLSLIVTLPFMVFTIWSFATSHTWGVLGQVRHNDVTGAVDISWDLLISTVFWNYNGFATVSTFAGEVAQPGTTFPRALSLTLVAVLLTYMFPLVAGAIHNDPSWTTWHEGSFSDMALSLGGHGLSVLITIATMASNWGQFNSDLLCSSFQLTGMAELGLAPAIFTSRSARGDVPYVSVALSFAVVIALVSVDFEAMLAMVNVASALSQVLLMAAGIRLRLSMPRLNRPYRVPCEVPALIALTLLPLAVCGYLMYNMIARQSTVAVGIVASTVVFGGVYAAYALKNNKKTLDGTVLPAKI
ncbi:hypothetical protein AC1031_018810 [Aphanomyces cochlioides]|nr:hypothetical protein AC1031_018810 [Aphanomyces cochlioides]